MADFSKLSDDQLLGATADQPEAFGVFYERHVRAVLAYATRETGDTEAALDLTAEVFAAALVASRRYRPGEAPAKAWLFGIAHNQAVSLHRRRVRADAARRKLGIPQLSFTDAALERVEEVLDAEHDGALAGMRSLSAPEREAVTERVINERPYAELAAATGASETVVRQRVSRGLAKLAKRTGRRP